MKKLTLLILICFASFNLFASNYTCNVFCLSTEEQNIRGYFEKNLSIESIAYLQNTRSLRTNETNLKSFDDLLQECKNNILSVYNKKRQSAFLATISPITGRLIGATLTNSCLSNP